MSDNKPRFAGNFDRPMIENDFEEPFNKWKADPSQENSASLIKAMDKDIRAAVKSNIGEENPIAVGRAKVMALKAMQNYNPKGSTVRTYLNRQLQGLKRTNRKQLAGVRVPEHLQMQRAHLIEQARIFEVENGREPSNAELSKLVKLPERKVSRILSASTGVSEGQITGTGDDMYSPGIESTAMEDAALNLVYEDESPHNQVIIEHTLGLHGKPILSNAQIAKKLGISPGAVSQRKAIIQRKLQEVEGSQ